MIAQNSLKGFFLLKMKIDLKFPGLGPFIPFRLSRFLMGMGKLVAETKQGATA